MDGITRLFNESNQMTNEKIDFLYTTVINLKLENEKDFQELVNVIQGLSLKFEFIKDNNELKNSQVYFQSKYFRKIFILKCNFYRFMKLTTQFKT